MGGQVAHEDYGSRAEDQGGDYAEKAVGVDAHDGSHDGGAGINMLHENVGWDFCHHVAEQAAAYAGDGSHKHQKEGVVCKALTDSGVDAHYGMIPN